MIPDVYTADTTALIDIWKHFPNLLRSLRKMAASGNFRIVGGVSREMQRKTDSLARQLTQWKDKWPDFVYEIADPRLLRVLQKLSERYGQDVVIGKVRYDGLFHSAAGRRAADAQVVAVGVFYHWIVVSDDKAVAGSCLLEGV